MKLKNFLLFTAAAAAAGVIAGILIAPSPGDMTRRRLLRKGRNMTGAAADTAEKIIGGISEAVDTVRGR